MTAEEIRKEGAQGIVDMKKTVIAAVADGNGPQFMQLAMLAGLYAQAVEIAAQLAELNQKQAQPQPTITQSGHNFTLDCPHCGVKTQGTITR